MKEVIFLELSSKSIIFKEESLLQIKKLHMLQVEWKGLKRIVAFLEYILGASCR